MKVGMITFHRVYNYGAVLQAYALQKTLEQIGYDVEIIDYKSDAIEGLYRIKKNFLHRLKTLEIIPLLQKKKRFQKFVNNNIKITKLIRTAEELEKLEKKYEVFLTGSDQVWCEKCAKEDSVYFLDFVKESSKKKSYAASIGKDKLNDEYAEKYKELLEDFSSISVREESAAAIVKERLGEECYVHVDPTLLLNSEQWNHIKEEPKEDDYILVYTVLQPYHLIEAAKKLAREKNCKIIYLNDRMVGKMEGIHYVQAASPEQFIGYFSKAKYVITNSFHGTVFSILYHKQFLVEFEAKGRRNIRSQELLKKLNLSDRELLTNADYIDTCIAWNEVELCLEVERDRTKEYFKEWKR